MIFYDFRGWNVCAVHGDKGQFDRNKAVTGFKDGTCPLLVLNIHFLLYDLCLL
jgi:superfamily II DNA/RNA helicase